MNALKGLLLITVTLVGLGSCAVFQPSGYVSSSPPPPAEFVLRPIDTVTLQRIALKSEVNFFTGKKILPSIKELSANVDDAPFEPPHFYPIVHPFQQIRNDSEGQGHFGASRGRRTHNGIDLIVTPGNAVYCPIEGLMKRVAYPYGAGRRNKKWLGCAIQGTGLYRGYEVKIFYMEPFLMGEEVYPNDIVGKAQAISEKYSSQMIDHLHVEVRYKGQLIDPAILFNVIE